MGGLVPLILSPTAGRRTTVIFNPVDAPRPSTAMSTSAPVSSATKQAEHSRKRSLPDLRAAQRLSMASPTPIQALPATTTEWKDTINEVKRKYMSHKYRSCSAQCIEILNALTDSSAVKPIRLVYLHFYAASSFEMCARPLSRSSSYRTKLLQDARYHYDQASSLLPTAEQNALLRRSSVSPWASTELTGPRCHSPSLSISSQASMSSISTAPSSPRIPPVAPDDAVMKSCVKSQTKKPKKKVSFSCLPQLIEIPEPWSEPVGEPAIRPDSPTLGWEEDWSMLRQPGSAPKVINSSTTQDSAHLGQTHVAPVASFKTKQASGHERSVQSSPPPVADSDRFNLEAFVQSRSVNRVSVQFSNLREQLTWHRSAVSSLLTTPNEVDDVPSVPSIPDATDVPALSPSQPSSTSEPTSARSLTPVSVRLSLFPAQSSMASPLRKPFRSSFSPSVAGADAADSADVVYRSESPSASTSRSGSAASSVRGGEEDIKQRIERLRASGWQRRRFDSRRYEALREQALGELDSRK